MRILVIPARSGSKRIPNKNTRPFLGVPVLSRTLAIAGASELFDVIHVSTDSQEIAELAGESGFRPQGLRPSHLASDDVPLRDVLLHEALKLTAPSDSVHPHTGVKAQIWMMLPCAALTVPEDLRRAARIMDRANAHQAVLSVAEFPAPVEWAMTVDGGGSLQIANPAAWSLPSQSLPASYYDTGMFSAFTLDTLQRMQDSDFYPDFQPVVIESWRAIDIDTLEDWRNAERVYPLLHKRV